MSRYRLAIFDLDGTLSDSYPWFLGIMNQLADWHRFRRIEADDTERLRGLPSREIIRALAVPTWRLPFIARDARRLKAAHLDSIPLFPDIGPMLERLAAGGVVLALVSSDSEGNARRALGPQAHLFRHYACGASLFGKARKFRLVLKHAGIRAAEAIAIGDETRDAEAAREAGIAFGAVSWGYARPEVLEAMNPVRLFDQPAEIADHLLEAHTSAANRQASSAPARPGA